MVIALYLLFLFLFLFFTRSLIIIIIIIKILLLGVIEGSGLFPNSFNEKVCLHHKNVIRKSLLF